MGFIDRFARELAGVFEKENKTTSVYRLRWYVLIKFFFKDKAEKIENKIWKWSAWNAFVSQQSLVSLQKDYLKAAFQDYYQESNIHCFPASRGVFN